MATELRPDPCIVCDRELEPAMNLEGGDRQPYGATMFHATGQYGSTVFDPMDSSYLLVNICDDCLTAKASKVTLVKPMRHARADARYLRWNPSE